MGLNKVMVPAVVREAQGLVSRGPSVIKNIGLVY